MVETIFIDTDVIVASQIKSEKNHAESRRLMDFVLKSKSRRFEFYVSVFSFLELASAIIRRTDSKDKAYSLLWQITKSWKGRIKPIVPEAGVASFNTLIDHLIDTAIKFKTRTGDTIQAHSFATLELKYFVTWNVKDFRLMSKKLKVKTLTPTDMLELIRDMRRADFRSHMHMRNRAAHLVDR